MKDNKPRISVQIVTWNSGRVIDACLASLKAQQYPYFEVIIVDNASADDTLNRIVTWLDRGIPGKLIKESCNRGFCAGQNRAFECSRGDLVLFLNPDVRLSDGFLKAAAEAADRQLPDVGTIAPLLLLPDGRVDSAGLTMDKLRRAYDRGFGTPFGGEFATEMDVFGCTGAAALHRRSMLLDVVLNSEVLDEALFAYYDDLDLAWRARLRGWRCRYVPSLVATHQRGGRNALRARDGRRPSRGCQRLTVRNRLLVMARCESPGRFILDLPYLLPFEIAKIGFLMLRNPAVLGAYTEALRALPAAIRSRRAVQRIVRKHVSAESNEVETHARFASH